MIESLVVRIKGKNCENIRLEELDLDILITHPKFSDVPVMKILESNVEAIADLIAAHTTTLVFANTRKMTETIVQKLRPFLGELVAGHHGSMDKKSVST